MPERKVPDPVLSSVAVFCGARGDGNGAFVEAAAGTGRLLAQHGLTLVYGGGRVGLMGVLADAALEAGGEVVGVIPRALETVELAHRGVTTLHVVDGMHERKALMGALADGFLALPGGLGTLEELFEVLTWTQLGIHQKPCCVVNADGFFDHLLDHLEHAVAEGLLSAGDLGRLGFEPSPAEALVRLRALRSPEGAA